MMLSGEGPPLWSVDALCGNPPLLSVWRKPGHRGPICMMPLMGIRAPSSASPSAKLPAPLGSIGPVPIEHEE